MAASIFGLLISPISAIIDKVITDKAAAQAAKDQLAQLASQGQLEQELTRIQAITSNQSDINKIEAASPNMFIAGWRPAVGWICATALGCNYVVGPVFTWATALASHPTPFPQLDIQSLMPLLFALLGMGTLRTIDKVKGVAGQH